MTEAKFWPSLLQLQKQDYHNYFKGFASAFQKTKVTLWFFDENQEFTKFEDQGANNVGTQSATDLTTWPDVVPTAERTLENVDDVDVQE